MQELLQMLLSIFLVNHKIQRYKFKEVPLFRFDFIVMRNSNCAMAEEDNVT
jgi:hypothetical protein